VRNLLRCRRGSVAFATVVALVPLIGVVALGAEAGSWYVTKQHAQNAADAAAYSGALTLGCSIAGITTGTTCDTAHDYVYRGKQFAARNAFCNTGDSFTGCTSLPTGTSQTVQIDRGTFAAGAWTTSATGNFVRATASQKQPAYLATVLGLSTVNVGAQAIAEVKNPKPLCGLGLGPSSPALTIGGSSAISGSGCALMSDTSVKYNSTPNFVGPGWAVDAVNGCAASAAHCALSVPYNYNMLPATNPLKVLDTESFNNMPNMTGNSSPTTNVVCSSPTFPTGTKKCYLVNPNSAGKAYGSLSLNNQEYAAFVAGAPGTYFFNNNITVNSGGTVNFVPGTYYFNGNFGGGGTVNFAPGTYFFNNSAINFAGTITCPTCSCSSATPPTCTGVTLVLLGTSSLTITGAVNLAAPTSNSFSSDLKGVLIDDQASGTVKITGNGTNVSLGGAMYFPNADVTYNGTSQNTLNACAEVIAKTLTVGGNTTYLSTQGCASSTIAFNQVIALVQ
jgi:hypothetical protein